MRKFLCFLLCAAALLGMAPAGAARAEAAGAEEQTVRVALSADATGSIEVRVEGSYECLGTTFSGGVLRATVFDGGVALSHSELGELGRGDSVTVQRREKSVWAAFLMLENSRYGTTRYLGDMIFATDGQGKLLLINRVGMAEYLYGVVGGELRNNHPMEALKAQAVAAKCFALTCLDSSEPYDLDDTPTDQVYKGYHPAHENVMAAVDAVKDDLLLYGEEVVRCYYCTSNGGQTITPRMRWGSDSAQDEVYELRYDSYDLDGADSAARLRVLPDARRLPEPLYAFLLALAQQTQADVTELRTVLALRGMHEASCPGGKAAGPAALAPQQQAEARLLCALSDGTERELICAFPLEELLTQGVVDCPEANLWFVQPEDDGSWSIIFSRSIGHRVGMSHYGMLYCAELGFTYDEILYFYYPGATLMHGGTEAQDDGGMPAQTAKPTPSATAEPPFVPAETEEPRDFWRLLFGLWV